jgi:hypothetical protein
MWSTDDNSIYRLDEVIYKQALVIIVIMAEASIASHIALLAAGSQGPTGGIFRLVDN